MLNQEIALRARGQTQTNTDATIARNCHLKNFWKVLSHRRTWHRNAIARLPTSGVSTVGYRMQNAICVACFPILGSVSRRQGNRQRTLKILTSYILLVSSGRFLGSIELATWQKGNASSRDKPPTTSRFCPLISTTGELWEGGARNKDFLLFIDLVPLRRTFLSRRLLVHTMTHRWREAGSNTAKVTTCGYAHRPTNQPRGFG